MTAGAHWASAYVGVPWIAGEAECWHFARRVWAERFGLLVAEVPGAGQDARLARQLLAQDPERGHWIACDPPRDGDAVLMARGARPCHVGIWVSPDHVLHSVRGAGGLFMPASRIADLGYRITGTWRRVS